MKYPVFFFDGVPNDYQQFWVHFEWFLSLFQFSDVNKIASVTVQAKSTQKWYFSVSNPIF